MSWLWGGGSLRQSQGHRGLDHLQLGLLLLDLLLDLVQLHPRLLLPALQLDQLLHLLNLRVLQLLDVLADHQLQLPLHLQVMLCLLRQ